MVDTKRPGPGYGDVSSPLTGQRTTGSGDRSGREDFADTLDYRLIFEQYAQSDSRGMMLVGARRQVLAMNQAARIMVGYEGPVEAPLAGVVRDIEFEFAVGDALHDRRAMWHESYAPDPDRLLRFHMVPILGPTEEPVILVVTIEDITHVRHLETVRRDFVANVSHELRTPIASINLLVETLQNGAMSDPEVATHFLRRIEVETQAMARLVEELLELSRLETGVLSLTQEPVDLSTLVEEVINRLAPQAKEKSVLTIADTQADLLPVRADSKRLEQVLMNLAHNAIKFTPAGGTVTIRAFRQGRTVQVEVVDTGVGMDSAEAARVFERFYKVDKGRTRPGGAGLGLAIARHLLELHGSQLHVVSDVGRGSRFYFSLPLADV